MYVFVYVSVYVCLRVCESAHVFVCVGECSLASTFAWPLVSFPIHIFSSLTLVSICLLTGVFPPLPYSTDRTPSFVLTPPHRREAAMGKRKSSKPPPAKRMRKMEKQFTCPFCNHEKSIQASSRSGHPSPPCCQTENPAVSRGARQQNAAS